MSFNMRDYVSGDHIESIGEIAKSQSAIIQALSLENSKLETQLQQKENIIKEVREYIENNSLYEQDYDYDYEENLVEYPPSDERARKDILEILDKKEVN